MVNLREINSQNVWQVMNLKVREDQQNFVALNTESLAEAYAVRNEGNNVFPFAVYDDDLLVGFVMIGFGTCGEEDESDTVKENYSLWRLMIDEQYQGRGYFKSIFQLVIDFVKTFPCGEAKYIWLSYEPNNTYAKNLYNKYGFIENGEFCDNEIMAVYEL